MEVHRTRPSSTLPVARKYLDRDWAPIPIPFQWKAPAIDGWQKLVLTEDELFRYFSGHENIGVLLGEPSGWLIDIDLDHRLAVELAPNYPPKTESIFGRAGKPLSHWLYIASGPTITYKRTVARREAEAAGVPPGMIVELRSTGAQTVFPGSVHPSGERIEWATDGSPAVVSPDELRAAVDNLARAVRQRLGLPPDPVARTAPPPKADDASKVRRASGGAARSRGRRPSPLERAIWYLQAMGPAIAHQGGDDHTFDVALALVKGFLLPLDHARHLMMQWNATCRPPWPEARIERNLQRAADAPIDGGWLLNSDRQERRARA